MLLRAQMQAATYAPEGAPGGADAPAASAAADPAAVPSPAATGQPAGGGGTTPPPASFVETLPEDIRGEAVFRDIKDLPGLAKSYVHATKMIGGTPESRIVIPTAPDAPEWDQVYTRLGRPESADQYGLNAAEGVTLDAALMKTFTDSAHKAGLSPRQAQIVLDAYSGAYTAAQQEQKTAGEAQFATATAELKTAWGAAYDQNLQLAKSALAHYGSPELETELGERGLLNSPKLAQVFATLGKGLSEDGVIGKAGPATGMLTPAEAQQHIAALRADPDYIKAATDRRNPRHAEFQQKMTRLYEMAHPAG